MEAGTGHITEMSSIARMMKCTCGRLLSCCPVPNGYACGMSPRADGSCADFSGDLQDPPEQVLTMTDEWLAGEKFVASVRQARLILP
jgi:hypothetical protein